MLREFYAYLYIDTRPEKKDTPIYAGKGQGDRYIQHTLSCANIILERKIIKMRALGLEPRIEIFPALSEKHAFEIEIALIAQHGRLDLGTGSLCNLTDGGEGNSGYIFSDELREKYSECRKLSWSDPEYKSNQMAAIKKARATPEAKAKFINAMKELSSRPGINERRSATTKATMSTPEYKAKWKASMSRPETIEQQSKNMKAAVNDPEYKAKKQASQVAFAAKKRREMRPDWSEEQHAEHDKKLEQQRLARAAGKQNQ